MQPTYYLTYIIYLCLILFLVFFDRKRPMQRFSWLLLLILLPVIGLLLYVFVGSDHLLEYRKEKIRRQRGDALSELENTVNRLHPAPALTHSSKAEQFHQRYCSSVCTEDNSVRLYTHGAAKFEQLFQELEQAEDHIHIQYFTIQNDAVGQQLVDILIRKAEQGVEVKLLYDSVGCLLAFVYPLLRKLKQAGAGVSTIRPRVLDFNYRNHRKIVIIDGRVGYTGGMNVGAQYKYGARGKTWRDTHLRITGGAVHYLQQAFLFDWITATKGPGAGLRREMPHYFPQPEPGNTLKAQVVANGLYDKYKQDDVISLSYFNLIAGAEKRVWVQTPYFVPSDIVLQALRMLPDSGVDVRVMTSSSYAVGELFYRSITGFFLRYLADSGVKVFKYDGIMHAKTLLVDDTVCIGTVNLNARSLQRDDEIYIYFESEELAAAYEQVFLQDLAFSREMSGTEFYQRSLGHRAVESILSFFAPLT